MRRGDCTQKADLQRIILALMGGREIQNSSRFRELGCGLGSFELMDHQKNKFGMLYIIHWSSTRAMFDIDRKGSYSRPSGFYPYVWGIPKRNLRTLPTPYRFLRTYHS